MLFSKVSLNIVSPDWDFLNNVCIAENGLFPYVQVLSLPLCSICFGLEGSGPAGNHLLYWKAFQTI